MRWDEMSMSQKSEAIGLMVRNGVTDINTMKQMWDDMDGRKKQKPSYAEWVKGVNPLFVGPDYNLKAAYDELPFEIMEAWRKDPNANHLPDTYKLPNHPTFSDESKYSQGPVMGGSWHFKPISQGQYLPEEILVGGINGVEPKPSYRSFAEGGFASPDHDPNHPYHYHVNGKKVVVTPEDWEKYKDDPTFREVRAAVEAEQAAHPRPEYNEVENPAWRKAYQNLVNGVNLRGRDNYLQPLPQGYTRDKKGVVMDEQGNYYLPVEKATDAPYFINQERGNMGHTVPVRYEQQQMPDRTIRQLRQPLPIDKVMDVGEEKSQSVDDYRKNNSFYSFNLWDDKVGWWTPGTEVYVRSRANNNGNVNIKNNVILSLDEYKKDLNNFKRWAADGDLSALKSVDFLESLKPIKPSRQEAEKKAVIKVGDLEKVGTFAEGGRLDDPFYLSQPADNVHDTYFIPTNIGLGYV